MIRKLDNVYYSTRLTFPGLLHGFTTKKHGNMQRSEKRSRFFSSFGIDAKHAVLAEQVHGTDLRVVSKNDCGTIIPRVDGLVYQKEQGETVFLVVRVGDCVPLLFVDSVRGIIGVAHSGRRGTMGHIAKNVIHTFLELGSGVNDIIVVLGPSICRRCYPVDLQKEIIQDLREQRISDDHIEYDNTLCTFERNQEFYSWRRKDEHFGEIMGYIG